MSRAELMREAERLHRFPGLRAALVVAAAIAAGLLSVYMETHS